MEFIKGAGGGQEKSQEKTFKMVAASAPQIVRRGTPHSREKKKKGCWGENKEGNGGVTAVLYKGICHVSSSWPPARGEPLGKKNQNWAE